MAVVVLSVGVRSGLGHDRCEWHAGGTAGEDDGGTACRRWGQLGRKVRSVLVTRCLVGKPLRRRGSRRDRFRVSKEPAQTERQRRIRRDDGQAG
jgi:hypothetical protein